MTVNTELPNTNCKAWLKLRENKNLDKNKKDLR